MPLRGKVALTPIQIMSLEQNLLDAVTRIYDAALDPQSWPGVLERVKNTVNATIANLFLIEPQKHNLEISVGGDPECLREYREYYSSIDYWAVRAKEALLLHTGHVFTSQMFCPVKDLARSEFYNAFLRRYDVMHGLYSAVFAEDSVACLAGFFRSERLGAFGETEISRLQVLAPHLQRAIQIHRRLGALERKGDALTEALDRLPTGLIVVDEQGKVIVLNRSAKRTLDEQDGLSLTRQGLAAARSDETTLLRHMLFGAKTTSFGRGVASGGPMMVSRPSLKRPLSVLVTPVSSDHLPLGQDRPAAAIFISDPETQTEAARPALGKMFGLTTAESRLAALLLKGKSLKEAAEELRVTQNTVRTHLKRIFDKTGIHRQGELIRLLLNSPAQISPDLPH